jgi:hypothetical protein
MTYQVSSVDKAFVVELRRPSLLDDLTRRERKASFVDRKW